MAGGKRPTPQCSTKRNARVDDGTLCRQPSPKPGPLGLEPATYSSPDAGGWYDTASSWLSEAVDIASGHSKSLLLSLLDLLPIKQASPFSTALLKHYVERSGVPYTLEQIPTEWQDWIVKATGGRLGNHRDLNPYNSGIYDLRNSLGHFEVEVKARPGGKTYIISDIYQFGYTKNDKAQRGRHGFPIGNPSGWQLEAAKKLLPQTEYQNPGGFTEKWEIKTIGNETFLFVPQQYLEEQGKAFRVTGVFDR